MFISKHNNIFIEIENYKTSINKLNPKINLNRKCLILLMILNNYYYSYGFY